MASSNRILVRLHCKICNRHNYTSSRNRVNTEKISEISKYCKNCRNRKMHFEQK